MWQCEGWLLGRRPLSGGPVDAASLARLVRSLGPAAPRPQRRPPMLLRCRDDRLELAARHDDEGFESDDDSRSLASDDTAVSNSSSCCFVDDHVYRRGAAGAVAGSGAGKATGVPPPPRPVPPPGVAGPLASTSSTTSDSANSSGASDTDEADHQPAAAGSVAALVQSLSLYQRVVKAPGAGAASAAAAAPEPEAIPVADVAFCHTDPSLPRVAVWVVRRRRSAWAAAPLDDAASQPPAGLEAIVFETNNERALRKLCNHFQEVSRRLKLDQYRHPHRRKEGPATLGRPPAYPSLVQPSASPSPSSSSYSSSPSPSPVGKQATVSLSSGISTSSSVSTSSGGSSKSQQRVEPAKVSTHQQQVFKRLEAPAVVARFNLLQRTDGDGVTHLEVARDTALQEAQPGGGRGSSAAPSGPSSIISLSTPDAPAPPTAAPAKQRPILVLGPRSDQLEAAELRKVWSPRPPPSPPPPPQRPERRRFARKSHKAPAPPPPPSSSAQQQQQHPAAAGSKGDRNKVLRGQLVSPSSAWSQYSVVRGSAWCAQPRSRSKSPPRPRRAAAAAGSRYAEAARFLGGLSQRLRDAVGGGGGGGGHPQHHIQQQHCSLYGTAARRRSTPDVFRSAENLLAGAGGHRLKSVIKKARRPDCRAEPKKVTFSAYATVQVVD